MTIPLQALLNAPATIDEELFGGPGRGPAKAERYGLSMWFKVVVDQIGGKKSNLGRWSSCSGLGVTFKTDELRQGGDYNGPLHLPGEINYGQIVLERAMDRADSAVLRSWLSRVATDWINADDAAPGSGTPGRTGYQGATMAISLYSNLEQKPGDEVAKWELRNVIPVAWSGPTLSAKGSEVALEKLTLVHRGFLDTSPQIGGARRTAQAEQGKLRISLGSDELPFQYNPVKVRLDQSVSLKSSDNTANTYLTAWGTGNPQPFVTALLPQPVNGIYDNLALAATPRGAVSFYNNAGAVNIIVDVQGYYTSSP